MRLTAVQSNLPDQLREIAALDRKACVERWTTVFESPPPKYLSVCFMQRVLARERQIRTLGGYTAQVRRALRAANPTEHSRDRPSRTAPPGSWLVREWNGRTYRLEVTSSDYVLDGKTYRSLSTVARRITGAHWSGPRFFGLTPKRAT